MHKTKVIKNSFWLFCNLRAFYHTLVVVKPVFSSQSSYFSFWRQNMLLTHFVRHFFNAHVYVWTIVDTSLTRMSLPQPLQTFLWRTRTTASSWSHSSTWTSRWRYRSRPTFSTSSSSSVNGTWRVGDINIVSGNIGSQNILNYIDRNESVRILIASENVD